MVFAKNPFQNFNSSQEKTNLAPFKKTQMTGYIFDLDGVIVDTAKFHFLAWAKIAQLFDFELTEALNEQLKGVSRTDSLQKILNWAGVVVPSDRFQELASQKNTDYLAYVEKMNQNDILPGVKAFLEQSKNKNIKIALGSASKNARIILQKLGIFSFFDAIVDGNDVFEAKPNPEIFLKAVQKLGLVPHQCIVFEDSIVGIQAAQKAQIKAIGIGNPNVLTQAHKVYQNFEELMANADFL